MKRVVELVLVGWFLLMPGWWISSAMADDPIVEPAVVSSEPAVVNNPGTAWELTKAAVDYLQPGYDWVFTFTDGEPFNGVSAALYTVSSKDLPIASIRTGYSTDGDQTFYGGVALDLPGIVTRYLPDTIKGASPQLLTGIAKVATKYLRVGLVGGYSLDRDEFVWGGSIGAAVNLTF